MRRVVFVSLFLLAATVRAEAPMWGQLTPGRYAVGFTQWDRYDASRPYRMARDLEGRPRSGERARPIRISIWYPAVAAAGEGAAAPLTFGDYLDLVAGETRFGAITADQKRAAERAFFNAPLLNTLTPEHRAKMRTLAGRALRDAKPADGKFPLILYSLGSAAIAHVTPEYLASHGYVVVQSPRTGAFAGLPQDNRDALDLETKLRDMDFILTAMRDFPQADLGNMAAIGFSAGGRWALASAMRNPDVRAVVSLDSVMLFDDPVTAAWRTMPHYNLDAVRVPVLHMVRADFARQEDPKLWEAMRYSDRTSMLFEDPALDHWDFQSLGLATALAGARGESREKVETAFDTFHRVTLAFLDAHLKGRSFNVKEQPGVKVSRLPPQAAPITVAEFLGALDEDGANSAIAAYRRTWKERGEPPVPEAVANVAGYTLFLSGRVDDGIGLLALNAEAYPTSANVWDSLADAYLAAGDRAKALELTKKAAALLDKDPSINDQRRALIRASVDAKLRDLERE
jgi:hypothetical protein